MTLGVLLGLTAALCWGVGDYAARLASRELGAYRALFYSQFVGLAGISAYLVASGELGRLLTTTSWQPWAWGVLASLLVTGASMAFFRAFEVGALALVSPIAASYGAVTAALSLLSGERLRPTAALGLAVALTGVILASVPSRDRRPNAAAPPGLAPGVAWALLASAVYGLVFWVIGWRVSHALGGVAPIWLFRVVGPLALGLLAAPTGQNLARPTRARHWWAVTAVGGFTALAAIATGVGLAAGAVTVVTVLGSLSTVVTVLLGLALLRERLIAHQWVGVVATVAGVLVLNL